MPSKSESVAVPSSSEGKFLVPKPDFQNFSVKEEIDDNTNERTGTTDGEEDEEDADENSEENAYPVDLPLEVITTIEPFNYAYPYLKNMSNGVLTHRNIFTEQEREVLRKIVDKYRDIVDTRSRTREIYLEKQSVWQQIVEEYNSTENILVRTEKELKKCWDNMKYRARQAEKEQQKVESQIISNSRNSPDPHQIACSAVQAALEKMLSIQTQNQNLNVDEESANGLEASQNLKVEPQEMWNCASSVESFDNGHMETLPQIGETEGNETEDMHEESLDDDPPVLKKARQESPKLSSILLGDTKKSTYLKRDPSLPKSNNFNIPLCTKVTHLKKKKQSKKSSSSSPVSILPKGLNSCVSITNIPNPNNNNQPPNGVNSPGKPNVDVISGNTSEVQLPGAVNLGGGVTISPQKLTPFPSFENCTSQLKQLPLLKKMTPNKSLKKSMTRDALSESPFVNCSSYSSSLGDSSLEADSDRGYLEERLLLQRLEFSSQEHALRMKVLEKQLQAYANESQFWALKMKALKEELKVDPPVSVANGEI